MEFPRQFRLWKRDRSGGYVTDDKDENVWKDRVRNETNYFKTASNMEDVFDPLRHKSVVLTPEERVRQWFISLLHNACDVPIHQMMSEVQLNGAGGKTYRADIVVYGHGAIPIAIVECKRPDVKLDGDVLTQALRYNAFMHVHWLFLTNGVHTIVCRKADGRWKVEKAMPSYIQMIENTNQL